MWAWNVNGVKIFDMVSANAQGVISGSGIVCTDSLVIPFTWKAFALPQGYHVEIRSNSNRNYSADGATFNMLLEVAALARQSIIG